VVTSGSCVVLVSWVRRWVAGNTYCTLRHRLMISCFPVATRASMISRATSDGRVSRIQVKLVRPSQLVIIPLEPPAIAILTMFGTWKDQWKCLLFRGNSHECLARRWRLLTVLMAIAQVCTLLICQPRFHLLHYQPTARLTTPTYLTRPRRKNQSRHGIPTRLQMAQNSRVISTIARANHITLKGSGWSNTEARWFVSHCERRDG